LVSLPFLRCRIYEQTAVKRHTAVTTQAIVQAIDETTDSLRGLLLQLATFYPPNHFGPAPAAYVDSVIRVRGRWLWLAAQPEGVAPSGTIVRIETALGVRAVVQSMIEDLASALADDEEGLDFGRWLAEWRRQWP
jgi:hypothetical protein